jgi:S-adenosylmethionine decarboxylase proenzyme
VEARGTHIICELSGCSPDLLSDVDGVRTVMERAALEANAEILKVAFHRFQPQGVSGVVVIAESHLSIHTWPESGYAAVDFYTCGDHRGKARHRVDQRSVHPRRSRACRTIDGEALGLT